MHTLVVDQAHFLLDSRTAREASEPVDKVGPDGIVFRVGGGGGG